ncbi:MAG: DUF2059 domain-containing protein [Verrucomicrobiales bacterium]|nr:DUF2059 domain-containing protein [Verrucomicrobiales bacterium]
MKKLIPLTFAAIVILAGSLKAQDADAGAVAAAKTLLKVSEMETTIEKQYESALDSQMGQFRKMGLNDASVQELKDEMIEFFKEVMPYSELEPELIKLYSTHFTESELKDLTDFYQTPTGKKALKLTPVLLGEGMKMGQKRVQDNMGKLQQRIMPIIQRGMTQ